MNRSRMVKLAGASVLIGSIAATGGPALAAPQTASGSVSVTYGTTSGCGTCRTLVLQNYDGSTLNGLDLSSGTNGFIAQVQDTGINPAALGNFSVFATMSNLYAYDTTTKAYTCGVSIPSSAVQLTSLPSLLNANGLKATVQPVFQVAGDLSSIIDSSVLALLPGITVQTNPVVTGVQAQTDAALTQADEVGGSTVSNLVGSLLNNLPLTLTSGPSGNFATPDAPPAGSNCPAPGGTATQLPVLNGALNLPASPALPPLLSDVQKKLGSLSVTQMVTDGFLDPNSALNLVSTATNIPASDLQPATGTQPAGPLNSLLTPLENALTGTVTGLVDSATTITGNYGAQPVMAISAPNAAADSYQGALTVTLTSGS